MKIKPYPIKLTVLFCFAWAMTCLPHALEAQFAVCSDPTMLFGMSNSGLIFPISSANASVGSLLNTANYSYTSSYSPAITSFSAKSPSAGNGIGYNNVNGRFYYFKRSPSQSTPQFVSYDPVTNKYALLATPGSTVNTNTGCVNFNGLGYYTINVQGQLWYYDIVADAWTFITGSIVDQSGANISSYVQQHASGDIAVDGLGNLWIMPSSSSEYGLFELPAPLPTTPQPSVTVQAMIPGNTPTPTGFSLWGIAFDPIGSIYMSTGDDKLYKITSVNNPAVFVGGFNGPITGIGADLASCAYPMSVLPVRFIAFSAGLKNNRSVELNWTITRPGDNTGFSIEHSTDALHWQGVGFVAINTLSSTQSYSFTHPDPPAAINYYRVRLMNYDGTGTYSAVKPVSLKSRQGQILLWPNPVTDALNIQTGGNGTATIFDLSGRVLLRNQVQAGITPVDLGKIPRGTYLVQVKLQDGEQLSEKIIKQ